ncbi:hypothetical protein [Streptomyces corynorhini]|uniref:Uncharacterized protein n=1 Tax=Streptomyces corynorhini TaxID=2282652 RepID=A0A370BCM4_9ACTN|nr:hypothetical protein [Streptomyces corynorhini]RDG37543.1 hypothetical protein DVH02_14055 [Streptomyces corynorhini]
MIVTLIVICEVGFWVLLAAGLALRYLARRERLGAAVLLLEPLLEVVLLTVTVVDLKNGAQPDWKHGLAALYIGFTVGYGHYLVKRADARFAHRFADGPPPAGPPRYGRARARHEGGLWLRTVVAAAIAVALLQLAIGYVGDAARTGPLADWQLTAVRAAGVHAVVALSYLLWRKKPPRDGAPAPVEDSTPLTRR